MKNDDHDIPQNLPLKNYNHPCCGQDSMFESSPVYSIGVWDPQIAHTNYGSDY